MHQGPLITHLKEEYSFQKRFLKFLQSNHFSSGHMLYSWHKSISSIVAYYVFVGQKVVFLSLWGVGIVAVEKANHITIHVYYFIHTPAVHRDTYININIMPSVQKNYACRGKLVLDLHISVNIE